MAFQVGTRVDPRLGALDFSGFAKTTKRVRIAWCASAG